MWRNDTKCKYMFMFPQKNLARKGVKDWVKIDEIYQYLMIFRLFTVAPLHDRVLFGRSSGGHQASYDVLFIPTLTIDHMLLECALLQECRDEYYTVDSLNALLETIPETCIVEFLREAGFFYLIWYNLLTSTSPQTCTIWSDLSNYLENENNSETHLLV